MVIYFGDSPLASQQSPASAKSLGCPWIPPCHGQLHFDVKLVCYIPNTNLLLAMIQITMLQF